MDKNKKNEIADKKYSRRKFIKTMGATATGVMIAPYISTSDIFGQGRSGKSSYLTKVAITRGDNYERTYIKQKTENLLDAIGGLGDIIKPGDKVAVKINLTGGSGSSYSSMLQGKSITETMWTHPEVLRAVCELLIDSGISGKNIYIIEALWDDASFNNFGYLDVQNSLGAQMINLNLPDPYSDFAVKEVGDQYFNFESFKINGILNEVDAYISIPKLKQHLEAGVTASLKNQVGIVPKQLYTIPTNQGRRQALHNTTGGASNSFLPRSVCDLHYARPVNLAVIDGILNSRGGEGVWVSTFVPSEDNVLLAGKNPVAADSVAAYLMGNNPEAEKFDLPTGQKCDNYLYLLHQKGEVTNQMNEIEPVGDGAGLITSVVPEYNVAVPAEIRLLQNYPNPFNPSTIIRFYLPETEKITIIIYDVSGREVETLVKGQFPEGLHELHWSAGGLASGIYIYRMTAGNFTDVKKMIYMK